MDIQSPLQLPLPAPLAPWDLSTLYNDTILDAAAECRRSMECVMRSPAPDMAFLEPTIVRYVCALETFILERYAAIGPTARSTHGHVPLFRWTRGAVADEALAAVPGESSCLWFEIVMSLWSLAAIYSLTARPLLAARILELVHNHVLALRWRSHPRGDYMSLPVELQPCIYRPLIAHLKVLSLPYDECDDETAAQMTLSWGTIRSLKIVQQQCPLPISTRYIDVHFLQLIMCPWHDALDAWHDESRRRAQAYETFIRAIEPFTRHESSTTWATPLLTSARGKLAQCQMVNMTCGGGGGSGGGGSPGNVKPPCDLKLTKCLAERAAPLAITIVNGRHEIASFLGTLARRDDDQT